MVGTELEGLNLLFFRPSITVTGGAVTAYNPTGGYDAELNLGHDRSVGWTHTNQAFGGYWGAEASVMRDLPGLEDWLGKLGYCIQAIAPDGTRVWEGFVNEVEVVTGGRSVSRGPLLDVANWVLVSYSRIYETLTRPATGADSVTTAAYDAGSMGKYGLLESILTGGSCTLDSAEQYRDLFLAENKEPQTGRAGGGGIGARISCLGYAHLLNKFAFADATSGTQAVSDRITAVLAACPNAGLFPALQPGIVSNPLLVHRRMDAQELGLNVIKGLVDLGDASDNRWLFGVWNDRLVQYQPAPTSIAYYQRVSDAAQRYLTRGGAEVKPWAMRPGNWILYADVLPGTTLPSVFREDMRIEFIESVTFTAPYGVEYTGLKISKLGHYLAKLGLGVI